MARGQLVRAQIPYAFDSAMQAPRCRYHNGPRAVPKDASCLPERIDAAKERRFATAVQRWEQPSFLSNSAGTSGGMRTSSTYQPNAT